ncbi:hypothetical protein F5Y15DRAFT_391737, partial [Xylariaceae sp. FL0016]
MVTIDAVRSVNAALVTNKPYVAVVAGGTAGIGECTVRGLATTFAMDGDGLRVYIVGRNQDAAEKIISKCERICPKGKFIFIGGDLVLLKEVDRVCGDITRLEKEEHTAGGTKPKVDFLLCSQGVLSSKFEETEEGLDKTLSLSYFSRMRFAVQLLPLLSNAPNGGHFVSVLNARIGPKIQFDDLPMRKPSSQGFSTAFGHLTGMVNVFISELARRNPGKVALCHNYPGFVKTNAAETGNLPWLFKFIWKWLIEPLTRPWQIPHEEVGQRMVFMASSRFPAAREGDAGDMTNDRGDLVVTNGVNGKPGSGAYRVDKNGDTYSTDATYSKLQENGSADEIYQWTMKVFADVEAIGLYSAQESEV